MFSILTSKIFGGLSLTLIVAIGVLVVSYESKVSALNGLIDDYVEDVAALKSDLVTSRSNVVMVEGALNQCNADILAAANAADSAARAGAAAAAAARAVRSSAVDEAARLGNLPTDGSTSAEVCEQAAAIIREGVN